MSADNTYQETRLGLRTTPEWALPASLFVSDLGIRGIPLSAEKTLPKGSRGYQVVDCHLGYQAGEDALLEAGFGETLGWHYEALGEPMYFKDGEGRSVQRWIRIFVGGGMRRIPGAKGREKRFEKVPLEVWRS